MAILDEIESLKDQITTLKDALHNSEDEKQQLQIQYQDQLQNVNDLKMEIEEWKCKKNQLKTATVAMVVYTFCNTLSLLNKLFCFRYL